MWTLILAVGGGWLVLSVVVGLVLSRAIRLRDTYGPAPVAAEVRRPVETRRRERVAVGV